MSEMEKLQEWLDKKDIKYERYVEDGSFNRNQIIIETDEIKLSFICHYGSYGYQQGLIEMYDFENEPIGFLTAKECISKLEKMLKKYEN